MWSTSVHILAENMDDNEKTARKVEFLRLMMLQHAEDVSGPFKHIIHQ
jgi:hypothetical protein